MDKINIIYTFYFLILEKKININNLLLDVLIDDDNNKLNYSQNEIKNMLAIANYIYEVENKFDLDKYMSKWD
jgi:hypothetical protein